MDDKALGNVAALGDADLVKKVGSLPVDRVAVVRVFPGGEHHTAVVTFYGLDGKAVAALNVEQGQALAKNSSGGLGIAGGVAPRAAQAVAELATTNEDAEEQYEKRAVWFQDFGAFDGRTGAMVATWSEPRKGKYGEPLAGADFYDYVGKPDLAAQYRAVESENSFDAKVGGFLSLGGLAFMLVGPFVLPKSHDEATGYDHRRIFLPMGIGGAAMITGLIYAVAAWDDPNPVQLHEAREMADKFNEGLKAELGIHAEATPTSAERGIDVAVAPYVDKNAGGLVLGVRF
jgi:hypothetical protein